QRPWCMRRTFFALARYLSNGGASQPRRRTRTGPASPPRSVQEFAGSNPVAPTLTLAGRITSGELFFDARSWAEKGRLWEPTAPDATPTARLNRIQAVADALPASQLLRRMPARFEPLMTAKRHESRERALA